MDKIICLNDLCLYWNDNCCILSNINLDVSGMCENCIYIKFSVQELNKKRKAQLSKYDTRL